MVEAERDWIFGCEVMVCVGIGMCGDDLED